MSQLLKKAQCGALLNVVLTGTLLASCLAAAPFLIAPAIEFARNLLMTSNKNYGGKYADDVNTMLMGMTRYYVNTPYPMRQFPPGPASPFPGGPSPVDPNNPYAAAPAPGTPSQPVLPPNYGNAPGINYPADPMNPYGATQPGYPGAQGYPGGQGYPGTTMPAQPPYNSQYGYGTPPNAPYPGTGPGGYPGATPGYPPSGAQGNPYGATPNYGYQGSPGYSQTPNPYGNPGAGYPPGYGAPTDPYGQYGAPGAPYGTPPGQGYPAPGYGYRGTENSSAADTSNVPIAFDVALVRQTNNADGKGVASLQDGEVLKDARGNVQAGDKFKIVFRTNCECFVYIVSVDGSGWAQPLFPSDSSKGANPVGKDREYAFPEGTRWFSLDQYKGIESVFFVVSPTPRPDLESSFKKLASQQRPDAEITAKVEEPPIIPNGFVNSRSAPQASVTTESGKQAYITPTTYSASSIGQDVKVTRWFRHE